MCLEYFDVSYTTSRYAPIFRDGISCLHSVFRFCLSFFVCMHMPLNWQGTDFRKYFVRRVYQKYVQICITDWHVQKIWFWLKFTSWKFSVIVWYFCCHDCAKNGEWLYVVSSGDQIYFLQNLWYSVLQVHWL